MYEVTHLNHGLTVASRTMAHMASVSLGLWVGVGGRYEPADANGICHFIEHLLFKGTTRRSACEISQAVEGIGGYLNAFTGEETTCFYAKARHDRLHELLDVLADMFLHSRFDPEDIAKERNVVKEEVAMYRDQPQQLVQELLNALQWPGQPLGRPLTGTPATIDGMTRPVLLRFRRTHYVAANLLVVAAGHVRHRDLVKAVRPWARRFPPGPRPAFLPVRVVQKQPGLRLATRKTEQTQVALGVRTCSRHDERRFALRLLNTILGENMSSRLFQVVREDRGLAYSIYSSLSFFADTGDLVISMGLDPDKLPVTLQLVRRELHRLTQSPPTPTELRRARDYVIGQLDLSLENTEHQMMWLGDHLLGYGQVPEPAVIKRRLAQIRARDLCAVARDFFRPERVNLALVSPLRSARHLRRWLWI